MKNLVQIYDTTLRDGTQRAGLSLSLEDKLRVSRRLDTLGVTFIEGGWPGSNPKDVEFFARAKDMEWKTSAIAAFGSTRRVAVKPEDDENLKALVAAQTPVCTIFGKTWTLHVTEVLRTTLEQNLELIEDSVAFLKQSGRRVLYDAEHFFDGYKADPVYAIATLEAARRGGAEVVVLCETNGGGLPFDVEVIVGKVKAALGDTAVGIHAHNDTECAVANSLAAVRAGAQHVQGTINGYGERCGNANLCAVIPNLELKLGKRALPPGKLAELTDLAHYVAEIANQNPDEYMAYVGRNAFAHKGGVHVAAMRRAETSYQHVDPALVGNEMRVVVSELSGKGNLLSKAEEISPSLMSLAQNGDVSHVLRAIKDNESRGFSYEAADASVALMMMRQAPGYKPLYELIDYMVTVEHRQGRGTFAEATVKVRVQGELHHTAAEGDGPVNALDAALRKALIGTFPQIQHLKLTDYKVRILDGDHATAAVTRVLIDSTDGTHTWGTVGASPNIIEASFLALTDALEYGLRQELRMAKREPVRAAGVVQ
jgi:2-isopropylmalate synthase